MDKSKYIARHDVDPPEAWQPDRAHVASLIETALNEALFPEGLNDLLQDSLRLVQILALFPEEQEQVAVHLAEAAGYGRAAFLAQLKASSGGRVALQRLGQEVRYCEVGDANLSPSEWVKGFAAAVIVRDIETIITLAAPQVIEACAVSEAEMDRFWSPYCMALAAVAVEPEAAGSWIETAMTAVNAHEISPASLVEGTLRPNLHLLQALLAGDSDQFNERLFEALTKFRDFYGQADEYRNWHGHLALTTIAIAALAKERGLALNVGSDYLPEWLVTGQYSPELTRVEYQFPEMRVSQLDEPRWFLDLEGIPRKQYSHGVFATDEGLYLRYDISGATGLGTAEAVFYLDEDGEGEAKRPWALDPGELLWLAEIYASEVPAELTGETVAQMPLFTERISDAIHCAETAMERLADAMLIDSPRGIAYYRQNPERFQTERLEAYIGGLAGVREDLLAQWEEISGLDQKVEVEAETAEVDEQTMATVRYSIELIRSQVQPLLEALGRDEAGTLWRQLRPRKSDYAKVFVGRAVVVAEREYEALFSAGVPVPSLPSGRIETRCYVSPAGMLRYENDLSFHFPQGYYSIARWLSTQYVWITWRYVQPPNESGQSFNGLVWVEDHWAWFPKPFRILKPMLNEEVND